MDYMKEFTVTLSIAACSSDCKSCDKNGAGSCDQGMCDDRFVFDSTDSKCKGKWDTLSS